MGQQNQQPNWQAIAEIISDFDVAMLTTVNKDNSLHARPMYIVDRANDGRMTFLSGYQTQKVDEILGDSRALVTLQGEGRYVALAGKVELTRNEDRIASLWKPSLSLWFPQGPADPSMTLIDFFPLRGEYWDLRGAAGVRFAWEALKAHLTGKPVGDDESSSVHGSANA